MDDKLRNNLCENLMTENNNNFFFFDSIICMQKSCTRKI